jgi:stage II sporulation protein D
MTSHPHRHSEEGFDYCDSTHCQHYQGEEFTARLSGRLAKQAAKETSGQILSFEGRPIEAYFTGACGGITTTPQVAWGTAPSGAYTNWTVRCTWCRKSRFYRWERRVDAGRLFDAASNIANVKLTSHAKIETIAADNGFVQGMKISDNATVATMSISKFRSDIGRILGWNTFISNAFTLERQGSEYVIRGRGFGHNVGLCIEGALRQSEAGRNWKTILAFYFPHADLLAS